MRGDRGLAREVAAMSRFTERMYRHARSSSHGRMHCWAEAEPSTSRFAKALGWTYGHPPTLQAIVIRLERT
jgi:hypothetical protein